MTIVLVISDLHMGAGPVDDFDREIEAHFLSFLERWKSEGDGVELVINGDLLDFVQAPPYQGSYLRSSTSDGTPLCFREEQSIQKLEAIAEEHCTALRAIGDFLAHRPANRVIILPGNHDADLFWPRVIAELRMRICDDRAGVTERLTVWHQPVYRPAACPGLWIEHGHQLDPVNNFFIDGRPCWSAENPPIREDKHGIPRLYECLGTRFLIQFLNKLDEKYPYVDNVKPFKRFLQIFGASALVPGYAPLRAAIAMGSIMKFVAKLGLDSPRDVFSKADTTQVASAAAAVLKGYEAASEKERSRFLQEIGDKGFALAGSVKLTLSNENLAGPFLSFLEENLDLADIIDPGVAEGTLRLGAGFYADETDRLKKHAHAILSDERNAASFVVMGHTHEVVTDSRYVNPGSWTRYYQVAEKERLRPWSLLRAEAWKSFPYKLNFVIAEPGANPIARFQSHV